MFLIAWKARALRQMDSSGSAADVPRHEGRILEERARIDRAVRQHAARHSGGAAHVEAQGAPVLAVMEKKESPVSTSLWALRNAESSASCSVFR